MKINFKTTKPVVLTQNYREKFVYVLPPAKFDKEDTLFFRFVTMVLYHALNLFAFKIVKTRYLILVDEAEASIILYNMSILAKKIIDTALVLNDISNQLEKKYPELTIKQFSLI